ncbi:MAG TPA: OmpA family protein [Acetobacteraceae bacterium]|nr:OmpA family protein [Acetobacteraceae bacterium]
MSARRTVAERHEDGNLADRSRSLSAFPDTLERLLRPVPSDTEIDRKALADLLLGLARTLKPDIDGPAVRAPWVDPRLAQLRTLLLGREIEALARLEDPQQFAAAVGRVLPAAVAHSDEQLGQSLAPALENATQSSIRANPQRLVNILYPLIVPAISKSIGETIDKTFQSLNETLKHSLTWRGLRWRLEAWRSGKSFAEVVLNHTLVYQVEHMFLIHRHTGLLMSHVAAENAESQDPQIVSSMLVAIQDFVRDSFSGAQHQGLDALRLGELRLWSEAGPFATLVAVIRGNPPEDLHGMLTKTLSRIHGEYGLLLENFDGDSAGLHGIETELAAGVAQRMVAPLPTRTGFPWFVALVALVVLLLAGAWGIHGWLSERRWEDYLARLRSQPGIVVTEAGRHDGKYQVGGLRDPLAIDPVSILNTVGLKARQVVFHWVRYEGLDAPIVLKRLQASLDPPSGVTFAVDGNRIVAKGSASAAWLDRARAAALLLPVGAPAFDVSAVKNTDAERDSHWVRYLDQLRDQPGIVVTETGQRGGKFVVSGLRDPLAADPLVLLGPAGVDPSRVTSHWASYESLDPRIVQKRLQNLLNPPPSVALTVEDDTIVAIGSAPSLWLERARMAARMLPSGAPGLDLSQVRDISNEEIGKLRATIESRAIRFDNNEMLPAAGQDDTLDHLASELNRLSALAAAWHFTIRVMVTGHADTVGKGAFNLSLSLARAEAVRALLKKRGVDPETLAVRGAGALEPLDVGTSDTARSADRRVSFTIDLKSQS